jgi:hypothetical protein
MDGAGVFIAVFVVLVFVVAPLLGLEDRPEFLRPERKPRPLIGGWFRDRRLDRYLGSQRFGSRCARARSWGVGQGAGQSIVAANGEAMGANCSRAPAAR